MSSKAKRPMSGMAKVRRIAENVIMVCLIIIMLFSAWKIYSIIRDYRSNQQAYDKISGQSRSGEFTGDIDFEGLKKINPDIVAWLYYKDSHIDYPVVMGKDNDQYLYTMFDGSYSAFGSLFVDAVTEKPFKQFNTIIYGHHMKNGSMFGDLKKLKDEEYCRAHPRLELITPDGKFHLDIWAFLNQPSDSNIYTTNIKSLEERQAYLDSTANASLYTTDLAIEPTDTFVILSTCAYEYEEARYMVVCKMTPWEGQNIDMNYEEASGEGENSEGESEEGEEGEESEE